MTYDESVRDQMIAVLERLGISYSENLRSLTEGYYHWHYLPVGALDREALIAHLEESGFFLWKEVEISDCEKEQ